MKKGGHPCQVSKCIVTEEHPQGIPTTSMMIFAMCALYIVLSGLFDEKRSLIIYAVLLF